MTAWKIGALVLAGAICFAVSSFAAAQEQRRPLGTIVSGDPIVLDGTTLEINGERIRLHGIYGPQRDVVCRLRGEEVISHQASTYALARVIAGRPVQCTIARRDDQGGEFGDCRVGTVDLSWAMVINGWAHDWRRYSGGTHSSEQIEARYRGRGFNAMQCRGLWGDERDWR